MQQIGRYEVLEEIARGGMGVVYKARDPISQRKVAIKVLLSPDPDPRFLQEICALARLQHPGIVAFYDTTQDHAGRDVVVMELVEGESLHTRIKRDGPLPLGEALDVTHQLAKALAYAHGRGVLHRDLKPHNVLIGRDGSVKLTDFGLGKVVDQTVEASQASLTHTGEIMGTPAYMPPEQAAGDKSRMGPASDVYGLGATLFAMLTGRPPFRAETTLNLIYALLEQPPPAPSTLRPEVPPKVDALVLRCLAKDPADRYARAAEVVALLEGKAEVQPPPSPPIAVASERRRHVVAAGLVILGLTVALVVVTAAERTRELGTRDLPGGDVAGTLEPAPVARTDLAPSPGASAAAAASPAPRNPWEAACARALEAFKAGRYEEARDAYTEAIRLAPDDSLAYYRRGLARGHLGDVKGMVADNTAVIRLEPIHPEAFNSRGFARGALGDFEGAIHDCTEAIRLNPNHAAAYFNRGSAHSSLGDFRAAREDCTAAIRLKPDYADAYYVRGVAKGTLDDHQGAVEDISRALELDPDAIWAQRARQNLHAARQRLAEQPGGGS